MLEPHTNFRGLSLEQQARCKQDIIRRARDAREQAVRDLARKLGLASRNMAASGRDLFRSLAFRALVVARRCVGGYADWRERRRAVRELAALDDCALKDIGIHRSEIESIIEGRDLKQISESEVPAALFHQRRDRPIASAKSATAQPIEKSAA